MRYLYEYHMGGVYTTDRYLDLMIFTARHAGMLTSLSERSRPFRSSGISLKMSAILMEVEAMHCNGCTRSWWMISSFHTKSITKATIRRIAEFAAIAMKRFSEILRTHLRRTIESRRIDILWKLLIVSLASITLLALATESRAQSVILAIHF